MPEPSKTSVIFVPGGWHTEFHSQATVDQLRLLRYKAIATSLAANSDVGRTTTAADILSPIKSLIMQEAEENGQVVVVGHSFGGFCSLLAINEVLEEQSAKGESFVTHVVLLASFTNVVRILQRDGNDWFHLDPVSREIRCRGPYEHFYQDMTEAEARPFLNALTPVSVLAADLPPVVSPTWRTVPHRTYIACSQDRIVSADIAGVEVMENDMNLLEIDSGHCPMVSRPRELADLIREAIQNTV